MQMGARGFATPTGKAELYSERLLAHGYDPLPNYVAPAVAPDTQPDTAERFPLILTSAKAPQFCHSQYRDVPRLRRIVPDPQLDIHPQAAADRGIGDGSWVAVETAHGRVRMRARHAAALNPRVVCAQHGWWQACPDLGLPGYDPYGPEGANMNSLIGNDHIDPISGSVPHRSYLCEVTALAAT